MTKLLIQRGSDHAEHYFSKTARCSAGLMVAKAKGAFYE